ncbi:MAG TPA: GNAT family N-acetyltransferase [Caulobacteraceae bacterium]|nr:GNAT family N-acetyltransferase [Caulobacteraceae bacterium]
MTNSLTIRDAVPGDAPQIWRFIRMLAEYERLEHRMVATEADIARGLFGPSPRVFADIAEWDGEPIGFSAWFYNFSTFAGLPGIYVEDLFVLPAARGRGAGRALLARLARRCLDEGVARLDWAVLDWNRPAIEVYARLGAEAHDDWRLRRLSGQALQALADSSDR